MNRYFEVPDPLTEPRVFRATASDPGEVGDINQLAAVVGGGTVHWDAKVPRFWDIDFQQRSALGPFPGADVADWPFTDDPPRPALAVPRPQRQARPPADAARVHRRQRDLPRRADARPPRPFGDPVRGGRGRPRLPGSAGVRPATWTALPARRLDGARRQPGSDQRGTVLP